jgi:hypothetical protein
VGHPLLPSIKLDVCAPGIAKMVIIVQKWEQLATTYCSLSTCIKNKGKNMGDVFRHGQESMVDTAEIWFKKGDRGKPAICTASPEPGQVLPAKRGYPRGKGAVRDDFHFSHHHSNMSYGRPDTMSLLK